MQEWFSFIGSVLFALIYVYYGAKIVKGASAKDPIRPHSATWLGNTSINTVTLYVMHLAGTAVFATWAAVFGSALIFVLALRYGHGLRSWGWADRVAFGGALLGAILIPLVGKATFVAGNRVVTGEEMVIGVTFLGSFAAAFSTYGSVWRNHRDEPLGTWAFGLVGIALVLLGMPAWTFVAAGQLAGFFLINSVVCLIILFRRATAALQAVPEEG